MSAIRLDVLLISDDERSAIRLALREESVGPDGKLEKKLDIPVAHPTEDFNGQVEDGAKLADDDALLKLIQDVCSRLRT